MKQRVLWIVILALTGSCCATEPVAVVLRQRLSPSCEILQSASVVDHKAYASVSIAGTAEEVFSPELSKEDSLLVPLDLPKKVLKLLGKSGFSVEPDRAVPMTAAQVLAKDEHVQCPSTQEAVVLAAQKRERRRQEIEAAPYRIDGRTVTAPVAIDSPEPTIAAPDKLQLASTGTESFRYKGKVLLSVVVSMDGSVSHIDVLRSERPDLEKKLVETVRQWRFKPAMKDGLPVVVRFNLEVCLDLY